MKRIGQILSTTVSSLGRWTVKPFVWFWIKYFVNEWEVTVWYDPKQKTRYVFKHVEIVGPKKLKGKLVSGEPFELNTQEPFNYQVRKIK